MDRARVAGFLLMCGVGGGAAGQCQWLNADPLDPYLSPFGNPSSPGGAGAYDETRSRVLVLTDRLWTWSAGRWQRFGSPGTARGSPASFDSARGRLIILYSNSLREWDGAAWTSSPAFGPARFWGALAYDGARRVAVAFGGENAGGRLADTWTYDGTAWLQVATEGPGPRTRAQMCYDSARQRIVLFGGETGAGLAADTWEWDGAGWSRAAIVGPPGRTGHRMAFDPAQGRTLLFGGLSGAQPLGDLWAWDGAAWASLELPGAPPPMSNHAMVSDPRTGTLYILGGSDTNPTVGGLWTLRGSEWQRLTSTQRPAPVYSHSMVYDGARHRALARGGWYNFGETWMWDGAQWTRPEVYTGPPVYRTAMAFDSARGVVVMFGGEDSTLGRTWEWDGAAWALRSEAGPVGRRNHGLVYDSGRGRCVLFGGYETPNGNTPLGDTWEWDGVSWAAASTQGPTGWGRTMAYASHLGLTILQQGSTTWQWDGAAWTIRGTTGAEIGEAMVYDSARGRLVSFGGGTGGMNATWEYDGSAWVQLPVGGPVGRNSHAMAYDTDRQRTVLFGGNEEGLFDHMPGQDTWELACGCYANCDASTLPPVLNVLDFNCFLSRFGAGAAYANCDGSTAAPVLNVLDFNCFLNRFSAGCP